MFVGRLSSLSDFQPVSIQIAIISQLPSCSHSVIAMVSATNSCDKLIVTLFDSACDTVVMLCDFYCT